ncbi:MAG: sulfate ABC transporter substrate-binding protein [Alphaproteobacteria bacterium]|nr:sulfate ABC transporter substrate-binding protein [Alphaproteobacteria bacterium]
MASRSMTTRYLLLSIAAIIVAAVLLLFTGEKPRQLLNVSYDPTRELFAELNPLFAEKWQAEKGEYIEIRQSHGGSGKQARSVIDGLNADVVTLALAYDIDEIAARTQKMLADWQTAFPNNSTPFSSTIVFLVRKGNPKGIKDWNDLVKPDVAVITPNPKTSGGARWNYLAAWAYADKAFGGDEAQILGFLRALYQNVPVLDTGARGSTTSFVQRQMGDVLISWENEALLAKDQFKADAFEIVVPSISVLAEPPVAVVSENAKRNGNEELAKDYLGFLYTPEAQRIAAKHHYRPVDSTIAKETAAQFPVVDLVTIDGAFGGWKTAQQKHFSDGGLFDQIYSGNAPK